jgi:Uma2 family endonuclease
MGDSARTRTIGGKLTYLDYVDLPDDGKRYEVLDGELAVTPSPLIRHQQVSANLYALLRRYVRRHDAGLPLYAPVDVILDRSTIVVPDLVFVRKARGGIVSERAVEGAPDLIVEILSAGTSRRDRGIKMKLYSRFGVAHYWIVDPLRQTIEMRERGPRSYRVTGRYKERDKCSSTLWPDLTIDLSKLWA